MSGTYSTNQLTLTRMRALIYVTNRYLRLITFDVHFVQLYLSAVSVSIDLPSVSYLLFEIVG